MGFRQGETSVRTTDGTRRSAQQSFDRYRLIQTGSPCPIFPFQNTLKYGFYKYYLRYNCATSGGKSESRTS